MDSIEARTVKDGLEHLLRELGVFLHELSDTIRELLVVHPDVPHLV